MADFPGLPFDDATSEEQQLAMAQALKRQQALGLLAQLSGDRVLSPLGQSLQSGAFHGQQMQEAGQQRRLQLALEAKQQQETRDYRNQELGLQGQHLRLAQQKATEERGRPFAAVGADGQPALYRMDRAGNPVALNLGAPPKAAPGGGLQGDKFKEQVLGQLGNDLDPYKGKTSLPAQAQKSVMAAERLETLLNAPGPMTQQRLEEAVIMAATVANGGNQPTESQVKNMYPETVRGNLAGFLQKVANNPQDIEAGPFIQLLKQQSEREKATAEAQIKKAFLGKLVKHSTAFQKYPEEARRIAKQAGLEGMYNPDTLEALTAVDPVASASPAAPKADLPTRIAQLKAQGMTDAAAIKAQLRKEGLVP
jgi:hypothetical protein